MSRRTSLTLLVAVAVLGLLGSSALAEIVVHNPVGSNQSSFLAYYNVGADAWNLWHENNHDTSGTYIKVKRPDLGDPSTWYINDFTNQGWLSNGGTIDGQWVVLDLGAEYKLDKIDLWNFYQSNNDTTKRRGVKDFEVWKADDLNGTVTATTALCTDSLAVGHAAPEYYEQFSLTGATDVRYVKILVRSSHNSGVSTDAYVGLGFVTFETVVPEPGTLALLAAGLVGLLAYAWRKRK